MRATFPHVEFVEGWGEGLYASIRFADRNFLILDDQMDEAGDSKTLSKLFTKGSHHRNLTVIYLVQNGSIILKASGPYRLTRTTMWCFETGATPANLERSPTRCIQTMRAGYWTLSNALRVGHTGTSYWTIILLPRRRAWC